MPVAAKKARKSAPKAVPRAKATAISPRRLRPGRTKILKRRKLAEPPQKIPSAWKITKKASNLLWEHKKIIIVITLVYGLLNLVLVRGFSGGTDVGSLKNTLDQIFHGDLGHLASSLTVFALLVTSAGNSSSSTAGSYQALLLVIVSLAIVWIFRQLMAGEKVRVRDGFYRGMYPLIPAVLVLGVIALQLIPLLIGSSIYSTVVSDSIAASGIEKLMWGILFFLLALLSLYMLCSSIFALYIVTLPDMTPLKALRSARELVRHRRWTILRKIIFLPLVLLIVAGIIMVPIIAVVTPLAQWVFFILSMLALAAVHAYMYTLYREML